MILSSNNNNTSISGDPGEIIAVKVNNENIASNNLRVNIKGDIYEAISNCDLIIGSHSTAVLNASKLNKNFLLVNTSKWGNYFQLSDEMFVENVDDLKTKIRQLKNQNLNKIKSKFFGEDDLDGSRWLLNQIIN